MSTESTVPSREEGGISIHCDRCLGGLEKDGGTRVGRGQF